MSAASRCVHCNAERRGDSQHTLVECNVRAFRGEMFEVWRCDRCRSIHASDDVDLDHYYADYPAHRPPSTGRRHRLVLDERLRRLERWGLRRDMWFLDFGCGNGELVRHLRQRGFEHAYGFDEFSRAFSDRSALGRVYDFVLLQDVIEHAEEPQRMLEQITSLTRPRGTVVVGTADAEAIDLVRPWRHPHELHVPYHRHIFTKRALIEAGSNVGWSPIGVQTGSYADTRWPWTNYRSLMAYLAALGGDVDAAYEPMPRGWDRLRLWRMLSPRALFWAFFGARAPLPANITVVFQRGPG